jgi:hypothetical protein
MKHLKIFYFYNYDSYKIIPNYKLIINKSKIVSKEKINISNKLISHFGGWNLSNTMD